MSEPNLDIKKEIMKTNNETIFFSYNDNEIK